jgi:DnaJ family protein C protein 3
MIDIMSLLEQAFFVIFLSLDVQVCGGSPSTAEYHFEHGKYSVESGHFAKMNALHYYSKAINGDPSNYLSYFERAAVYLEMGKMKLAIPDLGEAINLKPEFKTARVQRADTNLKLGNLKDAEEDYNVLMSSGSHQQEAAENLEAIEQVRLNKDAARQLIENREYEPAIKHLTAVIEVTQWDADARLSRANCYIHTGDLQRAILDIRPTTKLINGNTEGFYWMSILNYHQGNCEDSLKDIRECLKLDQDNAQCRSHYKKVKKLQKFIEEGDQMVHEGRYEEALPQFTGALKVEPRVHHFVKWSKLKLCHCSSKLHDCAKTMRWCRQVLEMDPHNVDALCDRAEVYLMEELYDEAISDYQKANEHEQDYHSSCNVHEKLETAQKLLKESQKMDYYKILGVKKTATKSVIIKAYHNLARKWHPDKFEEEDKEIAHKKFINIAAAKEVLMQTQ